MRPVEIVGGGVAGLSLAIGLRHSGVEVTLREAGSYPRHRLCGEFVNGVSEQTLDALGVRGIFHDALTHREMQWWLKEERIAQTELPHPVQALSRWAMDERMRRLFVENLGGTLCSQERVKYEPLEGRVWTAGRRLQKESRWLGLKAHFLGLEMSSGLEMHLGDGGYLGLTPVEDGRVNVCGLFERQKALTGKGSERLLNYLDRCGLHQLSERLRAAEADERSVTGISGIAFGQQDKGSEMLALGDAERMIPPFTGNGMSMAFEAAECALEPLLNFAKEKNDWKETRREVSARLQSRFRRRIAVASGIHGLLLTSPARELIASAAKPGLLPFGLLNRILT